MWKVPRFEAVQSLSGKSVDTGLVFVSQPKKGKKLKVLGKNVQTHQSLVDRLQKKAEFEAKPGQFVFVRFSGKGAFENTVLVGLGNESTSTDVLLEKLRQAGATTCKTLASEKITSLVIEASSVGSSADRSEDQKRIACFCEGMALSAYDFENHKSKASKGKPSSLAKVYVRCESAQEKRAVSTLLGGVQKTAQSVNLTRDWSNEPSNFGTPLFYAAEAKKWASQLGLKCKILTDKEAKKEKMDLFLSVGQGSGYESRVVVLEYNPPKSKSGKKPKTIALVGKGVTFDTGGISLKPSANMDEMKHDMTGAATVMGAIALAAQTQCPNRVIAFMGFTVNSPSGTATHPGDVVASRSGKTVEILNTDAEGRLVLADVMDYAQDYKPDVMIDVATLTGAVIIALGNKCTGIMGNDPTLVQSVIESGNVHCEKYWELPVWDEYFDEMKSAYADMSNISSDRMAGTIRGGIFLKQFVKKGVRWAHIDIAATATNMGWCPYYPKKGASGVGVRTLAQFCRDF